MFYLSDLLFHVIEYG
ncbi:hypothetical protein [Aeromonas hydrophila]